MPRQQRDLGAQEPRLPQAVTGGDTTIIFQCLPVVLFLDTPRSVKVAEHITQRSVWTLYAYERRGLRIRRIPGEARGDNPSKAKHGTRAFIVTAEYTAFLRSISE